VGLVVVEHLLVLLLMGAQVDLLIILEVLLLAVVEVAHILQQVQAAVVGAHRVVIPIVIT
jgi:hypothetical protein